MRLNGAFWQGKTLSVGWAALAALWLAVSMSGTAHAATLLLWPVHPVFAPGESAAALWVENRGDAATWLQVRVFAWQQANGENHYREQQDVISSPPMMQVGPGERHLVRLMRQTPAAPGTETAWRVILDEVPQRSDARTGGPTRAGINLQMRYSLPLFGYGEGLEPVPPEPSGEVRAKLAWRVIQEGGKTYLEVANRGDVHARLTDVSAVGAGGTIEVADGLLGYVLPHSRQRWPLPAASVDSLTARVNGRAPALVARATDAP